MPNTKSNLTTEIADRLVKLLGMLGSKHSGERAAAALKADELVKREGLRWCDMIQPRELLEVEDEEDEPDWRGMVKVCMAQAAALSARELQFVRTMTRWRGEPTDKQLDWLEGIYDRIGSGR